MSAQRNEKTRRLAAPDIAARKGAEPVVCLTCYTTPMAQLLDPHCDVLLVGDSVGMVLHGMPNTVGVTLGEEQVLKQDLAGYTEYMTKTPWRIVPGVW